MRLSGLLASTKTQKFIPHLSMLNLYELYHTEAIENAFADIDKLTEEAK